MLRLSNFYVITMYIVAYGGGGLKWQYVNDPLTLIPAHNVVWSVMSFRGLQSTSGKWGGARAG